MVELWRWVMVAGKRLNAIAADHTGSSRAPPDDADSPSRGSR